jgi:hypothetical protein
MKRQAVFHEDFEAHLGITRFTQLNNNKGGKKLQERLEGLWPTCFDYTLALPFDPTIFGLATESRFSVPVLSRFLAAI